MKTFTAILIIFCAYLYATDSVELVNITEDVTDIKNTAQDVAINIIPRCIFGKTSVSMFLYNKNDPYGKKNIDLDNVCVDFDKSKPIAFLVHGFLEHANYSENYELAKALVEKGAMVYSLDWSDAACRSKLSFANVIVYRKAVKNTREVGELMAKYVVSLIKECNASLDDMIFIGHSLGAHVSGFASKEIQKSGYGMIPLLFGVDPAMPLFALKNCNDRLCVTDAENVIVLHTSMLGIEESIGDIDLYFNGGSRQPSCSVNFYCSHMIPVHYLAKIVKHNCGFPGVPIPERGILDITIGEPDYPQEDTTECLFMDRTIFNKTKNFDKIKGNSYHMFVDKDTLCTTKTFNCQH